MAATTTSSVRESVRVVRKHRRRDCTTLNPCPRRCRPHRVSHPVKIGLLYAVPPPRRPPPPSPADISQGPSRPRPRPHRLRLGTTRDCTRTENGQFSQRRGTREKDSPDPSHSYRRSCRRHSESPSPCATPPAPPPSCPSSSSSTWRTSRA